jgi:hypothetical protein
LGCQSERLLNHSFSAGELRATAHFNGLTDASHRMVDQELQHPHVASRTSHSSVIFLKLWAELSKAPRKLPFSVHRSMVQCPRLTVQSCEVMQWVRTIVCGSRQRT